MKTATADGTTGFHLVMHARRNEERIKFVECLLTFVENLYSSGLT